jgi:tetratricopeptide (TPR) repeat protein
MRLDKKHLIIYAILIVTVFGVAFYKIAKVENNSHFEASSPGSLYYAEAAFHYRYAEIIAKTKTNLFHILTNDKAVQYPDTINIFKIETVMMEFFYGFLYRMANFGLPFNLFLIYASSLFSSLTLIGVFLIARKIFKNDVIALGAALFYATTPASYLRTAAGSFLREDFALVFLLISVLLIISQLEKKSGRFLGIASGLLIVFSLSSWHFNQFIYICMIPFFFWLFIIRPELLKNFSYTFMVVFAAGLMIPVLTTRGFAASILMCALYAIIAAYFLCRHFKNPFKRALILLIVFAVIMGIRSAVSVSETAYSHVFDMFMEKLKFFLQKPDNPSLLSFSARQLWESAFDSPQPGELWWLGRLAFPIGLVGSLFLLWKERKLAGPCTFIASFSIVLFLLSIMAKRILVIDAPFMAIAMWGCALYDSRKNYIKYGFCFLLILNSLDLNLRPIESGRFTAVSYRELFKWIDSNTRPDDAFAAHIHLNSMILLNTGRPEVLHPKFENLLIRNKYEQFIKAIYSKDEERLFEFCRNNRARYIVYDWGFFITDGKDSIRYLGEAVPNISEKAMASRLHFSDTSLRHFKPVFRNSAFIVYEVTDNRAAAKTFPYSPIYDDALYEREGGFYKNTRRSYDTAIIPYAEKVNASSAMLNRGEAFMVADLLKPVVEKIPRGSEAVFLLAQAFVQLGQVKEAEKLLLEYLGKTSPEYRAVEPMIAKMLEMLADTLYYQGRYKESFDSLKESLKMPSHTSEVYKKMGILKKLENKTEEAEEYIKLYEKSRQPPIS